MDEKLLVGLTQTLGVLSSETEKKNRKTFGKITARQLMVLAGVASFDSPPTLGEVTKVCGGSYQSIRQILNRLEEYGFLWCQHDENDRRRTLVFLTEAGRDLADKVIAHLAKYEQKLGTLLTEDEIKTFIKVAQIINDSGGYLTDFPYSV